VVWERAFFMSENGGEISCAFNSRELKVRCAGSSPCKVYQVLQTLSWGCNRAMPCYVERLFLDLSLQLCFVSMPSRLNACDWFNFLKAIYFAIHVSSPSWKQVGIRIGPVSVSRATMSHRRSGFPLNRTELFFLTCIIVNYYILGI
jgi:hypothetical protein